jgi:SAM-dependent methyltransferase
MDFDPVASFGEDVAAHYDDDLRGDETETVDFLHEWARGGPVLEFAIGTGRVALPLTARGVRVDGIEQSAAMLSRLRSKPGSDAIAVTVGDMAAVETGSKYRLVFLVYNTLYNLLTQDDQVRCFENAARHLEGDGVFIVEAELPNALYGMRDDQYVTAETVGTDRVTLDVARYDPVTQRLSETHVHMTEQGIRLNPIETRYAWPSELDLMARVAGLRLHERWGGWTHEPFDSRSTRHVSVYAR